MKSLIIALLVWISGCSPVPSGLLASGPTSPSGVSTSGGASHKLGTVIVPQQVGDFWVNQTAVTPFALKDAGGVTRDTFETAHGRITAGNGGTDREAIIGPSVGAETSSASLYLLPNGTAASANNFQVQSDGTSYVSINAPNGGYTKFLVSASIYGAISSNSGSIGALWLGNIVPSATNYAIQSDGSTVTTLGAGTPIVQLAGGTQNGVALGSNLATVGHIRTPKGFQWMQRNAANSADTTVFTDDGANNWTFGDPSWTNTLHLFSSLTMTVRSLAGSAQVWAGGVGSVLDLWGDSIPIGDHSGTNYITITPGATTTLLGDATNTTSFAVGTAKSAATLILKSSNNQTSATFDWQNNTATIPLALNAGATNATNTFTGGFAGTTVTIVANRTLDTTTKDNVVIVDTSGGVISVTLPAPSNGRSFWIIDKKNTFGTNNCTIVRNSAEKINNVAASKVLSANGYRGYIWSDGTDWYTQNISGMRPPSIAGIVIALGLYIARRRRTENEKIAA